MATTVGCLRRVPTPLNVEATVAGGMASEVTSEAGSDVAVATLICGYTVVPFVAATVKHNGTAVS